jgi:hypothetical protein
MIMNTIARKSILLTVVCFLLTQSTLAQNLYVFYPTDVRPAAVESQLKQACAGVQITIFGRQKDFASNVTSGSPEAVLTSGETATQLAGYAPKLQGVAKGAKSEDLILVSVDKGLDVAGLGSATIGVVDILGRKGMADFVGKWISPAPQVNPVAKIEDLLPLLSFNMAQGIFITKAHLEMVKKASNLNFVITEVPVSPLRTEPTPLQ